MKIGVKIGPALEREPLRRAAMDAEAMGFHSVWLSERVAVPLDKPHPYQPMVDPWVALAFVAAVTERVVLGTSVSQIGLRPPVLMARELATLDRLSGGNRLIVGAGAGWVEEEFTSTGVPFETRGGRLNEFVQVLRHLWTKPGEPWQGKHFQIPAVGMVSPMTPGGPPIYIGAGGPPGLRRVARYGDGYISTPFPPADIARLRQRVLDLRQKYGRSGPFPVFTQAPPPENPDAARKLVSDYGEAGVDGLILASFADKPVDLSTDPDTFRTLLEAAAAAE